MNIVSLSNTQNKHPLNFPKSKDPHSRFQIKTTLSSKNNRKNSISFVFLPFPLFSTDFLAFSRWAQAPSARLPNQFGPIQVRWCSFLGLSRNSICIWGFVVLAVLFWTPCPIFEVFSIRRESLLNWIEFDFGGSGMLIFVESFGCERLW